MNTLILDDEEQTQTPDDFPRAVKPWPLQSADSFMEQVRKLKHSPKSTHRGYPAKVQKMLEHGLTRFTVGQWSQIHGMDRKDADYECRVLYQKGLADRHMDVTPMEYSFRIAGGLKEDTVDEEGNEVKAQQTEANESPPEIPAAFEEKLRMFEQSKSDTRQRTAAAVRMLLSKGITTFLRQDWADYAQLSIPHAKDGCDAMMACGMIVNTTPHIHPSV